MVRMLCSPKSPEANFLKRVHDMNAHDLQIIYEVFKLPDAVGSSTDNVVSEVMVSGAKNI